MPSRTEQDYRQLTEQYNQVAKERDALKELLESIRIGLSTSGTQMNQLANQLDQAKANPVAYMELAKRQAQQQLEQQRQQIQQQLQINQSLTNMHGAKTTTQRIDTGDNKAT